MNFNQELNCYFLNIELFFPLEIKQIYKSVIATKFEKKL